MAFQYIDEYLQALIKEIELSEIYDNEEISSIYLGGGTPSVLSGSQIRRIFNSVSNRFLIGNKTEITIEANPDDLSNDYLKAMKELGINRLSIGVQSLFDNDLELMNRSHRSTEAIESIKRAATIGFKNINVDLIYGLPGLTNKNWKENLIRTFDLPIHHLSAYHLTYEKDTVFELWRKKGRICEANETESIKQYEILRETASNYGYEHYEVSNFALKGYRSRHNSIYWGGNKYYGFGASAHSYDGIRRRWNISSVKKYIQGLSSGNCYFKEEELTLREKYNELLITKLRTAEGIRLEDVRNKFGDKILQELIGEARDHILHWPDDLILDKSTVRITPMGWLKLDQITRNLMID